MRIYSVRKNLRQVSPLQKQRELRDVEALLSKVHQDVVRLNEAEAKIILAVSPFGWGKGGSEEIRRVDQLSLVVRRMLLRRSPQ